MIPETAWQRNIPEQPGDWLWIEQWGCGCCLIKYGFCAIRERPDEAEGWDWGEFEYKTPDGRTMSVAWEGHPPTFHEGKPCIHWWVQVELPDHPDEIKRKAKSNA